MRKYQYVIKHQAGIDESLINRMGKDGWELVCYWPDKFCFFFKRELLASLDETDK